MSFIHSFYQKVKVIFKNERKEIWLAKNSFDGELCIIKLQYNSNQSKKSNIRTVLHEGKFLQTLQGYNGIPFMYWAGREDATGLAILIVQRLGKTLDVLFNEQGKRFSIKTVCQIGISLLKMIHTYHDKGFTHGCLKPSSLQLGVGKKCNQIFFNDLIDSGTYIKKGKHIKQKQYVRRGKINQFLSIDRLQGYEGSRRDDIESIIYVLIYFVKGELPWTKYFEKPIFKRNPIYYQESQTILIDESISKEQTKQETMKFNKPITKENSDSIYNESLYKALEKVQTATVEEICEGTPKAFYNMLVACKGIQFDERPDYSYYIRTLEKILEINGFENDSIYDWMIKKEKHLVIKKQAFKNYGLQLIGEKQILQNWYFPFQKKVQLQ